MSNIPEQIKDIRNTRRLSQKRFGIKIGVSGKTISAYETGRITPPLKVLEKISNVYNTSIINLNSNEKNLVIKSLKSLEKNTKTLCEILEKIL